MSERLPYADEEDHPGQFGLWNGNVNRSLRGRKGQAALKRLETALVAMTDKRLTKTFAVADGEACALSQMALHEGKPAEELEGLDDDIYDAYEVVAKMLNIPKLVAWAVIEANDEDWWYPNRPYIAGRRLLTGADRHEAMLTWVRERIMGGVPDAQKS